MKHIPVQSHPVLPYHVGGGKRPLSCQGNGPDILHPRNYLHLRHIILNCLLKPETETSQYPVLAYFPYFEKIKAGL
jgi:uncharacterized Zn-finger protein